MTDGLVVFLGPSLSADEARTLAPGCTLLPPAQQGDVWAALARGPSALALIDGVFESKPSVWHQELLGALDAGVAVFAGGSMGALRAAELEALGVVGVGAIFEAYRDGLLVDDSEVALLHAEADFAYRAMTVPLVNVRHAAARAVEARVLSRSEGMRVVEAAAGLFYQERTWRQVLTRSGLSDAARVRWEEWAPSGAGDLKADDARAVLRTAQDFLSGGGRVAPAETPRRHSSAVRWRRMQQAGEGEVAAGVEGGDETLLAAWARSLELAPDAGSVAEAEAAWLAERAQEGESPAAVLARHGLEAAQLRRLAEDQVLAAQVRAAGPRLVPDGPSEEEAAVRTWRWTAVLPPPRRKRAPLPSPPGRGRG